MYVRTNLTAVFDPVAVPVSDGLRIRVGVRNSGPGSISLPTGMSAVGFQLTLFWSGPSRALGNCRYSEETPPMEGSPPRPAYYECGSGPTLRAGETYWESFIMCGLVLLKDRTQLAVAGHVEETFPSDNTVNVNVRLAPPGSGLPVTGTSAVGVAGAGLALIIVGITAVWYGRRRRPVQRDNFIDVNAP
jgi:LPXTG-motif cell wall-anchored protein